MESSSSSNISGSSKRAKAPSSSSQVPHCLVDGCVADLSLCTRDYHRRHKVCEVHAKSPRVTIEGREQRFCQQCSRFHSLIEFDEVKRSCRKRLEGHNRRRRKPQPESLIQNPGFLFSNQSSYSGARILSFGDQQILPSSIVPPGTWPGLVKAENDITLYTSNQHHLMDYNERPDSFLKFSSYNFKGPHDQQHRFHESSSINPAVRNPNFFTEGLNHQVADCDRALSLLSPVSEATHKFSLNHAPAPPAESSVVRNFNYDFSSLHHEFPNESSSNVVVSSSGEFNESNMPKTNVSQMFQHEEGSSSGAGSHQTLSFMWK